MVDSMFNLLTDKLQDSIQFLSGQGKITEENIDSTIQDIRKALLEADVSLSAVKLFILGWKKKLVVKKFYVE